MKPMLNEERGYVLVMSTIILLVVAGLTLVMTNSLSNEVQGTMQLRAQIKSRFAAEGVLALVMQEVYDGNAAKYVPNGHSVEIIKVRSQQSINSIEWGRVTQEVYEGLAGSSIADLETDPRFGTNPTHLSNTAQLGHVTYKKDGVIYGRRIRGYLHPPQDGNYRVDVCYEGTIDIQINPNGKDPFGKQSQLAGTRATGETGGNHKTACQFNLDQFTLAGLSSDKQYYFEILQTHTDGVVTLRWELPDGSLHAISGDYMSAYRMSDPPYTSEVSNVVTASDTTRDTIIGTLVDTVWDFDGDIIVDYGVIPRSDGTFNVTASGHKVNSDQQHLASLSNSYNPGRETRLDILWAPVIFYDFHPDNLNPSFETVEEWDPVNKGWINKENCPPNPSCTNANSERTGDVKLTLGADMKPVPTTQPKDCAALLSNYWRPSGPTDGGCTSEDKYDPSASFYFDTGDSTWKWTGLTNYLGRPNEYVSTSWSSTNSMANVVIYDSIPFIRDESYGPNYYTFIRMGGQGNPNNLGDVAQQNGPFYPLEQRGFGQESIRFPKNAYPAFRDTSYGHHNYSFTMELHTKFKYESGQKFFFAGDDGIYVFIDKSLALDLGGTTNVSYGAPDSIALDSLGLTEGEYYNLDIFTWEREAYGSKMSFVTNIPLVDVTRRQKSYVRRKLL